MSQDVKRIHYRSLGEQLDAWMSAHLWAQVIAGLILGLGVGLLFGPDLGWISRPLAETIGNWLALPGQIFLGLIKMVLMPLVASSIVLGLAAGASNPESLRTLGTRLAIFVTTTTALAATLGASLALLFRPGRMVEVSNIPVPRLKPDVTAITPDPLVEIANAAPTLIAKIVPENPLAAAVSNEMLAIVVFSVFLGLAYVTSDHREKMDPLVRVLEALLEVSMTVVKWAMYLTPYAVFGLTAQMTAQMGVHSLFTLTAYLGTVLLGLFLLLILYLVLVGFLGRISPWRFLKAVGEAQLLAFSTSSSAAVMPVTIETAVEKLRVPSSIASFVIPLCSTVNMAGTALYQATAVIFVAQIAGVHLEIHEIALIILSLVAASIGAPGAPGVSIAILSSIIVSFGIPPHGLVFVLGLDRILDMARTAVNVTGDLAATRILSPKQSELTPEQARHS
ncbi:dicarboxylate/amino acid:cation symporter [Woodsholea maritima]|uniref:dicarboxylate/amino acid:cation symporter n=1 Tax=Woodsholea maritima TaxID=240237 RepID=UPI0005926C9C|nr:dicarboxylate/amino acid:cation symporter [Woodsholea maritima]